MSFGASRRCWFWSCWLLLLWFLSRRGSWLRLLAHRRIVSSTRLFLRLGRVIVGEQYNLCWSPPGGRCSVGGVIFCSVEILIGTTLGFSVPLEGGSRTASISALACWAVFVASMFGGPPSLLRFLERVKFLVDRGMVFV